MADEKPAPVRLKVKATEKPVPVQEDDSTQVIHAEPEPVLPYAVP